MVCMQPILHYHFSKTLDRMRGPADGALPFKSTVREGESASIFMWHAVQVGSWMTHSLPLHGSWTAR